MPVDTCHAEYLEALPKWERARDVAAGEDAIKAGGERYLPRLDNQSDEDYARYRQRACFFNATARTHESLLGLVFRVGPKVAGLEGRTGMAEFVADVDLLGNTLEQQVRAVMGETLLLGRCGLLVDWTGGEQGRAVALLYRAEDIINWRVTKIGGRPELTLLVLREWVWQGGGEGDLYAGEEEMQLRVYRVHLGVVVSEVWRQVPKAEGSRETEWRLVETTRPMRRGQALERIPFVLVGGRKGTGGVMELPLGKLMAVNLDHFRLDADYKHGLHYTALPTAWVTGMESKDKLVVGSRAAWVLDSKDARVGYLEFTGQGLQSFERALDRDERLMTVLGTRMLESQKRAYESAQAIEMRQTAEHSSLGVLTTAVSEAVTEVLRWVCWWNSAEADVRAFGPVAYELTKDFTPVTMTGDTVNALVNAWEKGAISLEALVDVFRRGEILTELEGKKESDKHGRGDE